MTPEDEAAQRQHVLDAARSKGKILVTGSSGLVGTALRPVLVVMGFDVVGLDLRGDGADYGSTRSEDDLARAMHGCIGVIHLAAISRVIWGEQDPELCWETNVTALKSLINIAKSSSAPPWVIFASSREVYGEPQSRPVTENALLSPINIYAETKVEGERLIKKARAAGIAATTVRLSNVYGSVDDHADRVVPAFIVNALLGNPLRIDGEDHIFDFTHLSDTTEGIARIVGKMIDGETIPTIHFVTGTGTTLKQLAETCLRITGSQSDMIIAPPRRFDVCKFVGSFDRANQVLGWRPRITLEDGLTALSQAYRAKLEL